MIGSDGPGCGAPLPAAVIVLVAVPVTPSLVAVIVAVPALTPVARPVAETVATAPLLVFQVTVRPVRACPAASRGVAVSCIVLATAMLSEAGLTDTVATGAGVPVPVVLA